MANEPPIEYGLFFLALLAVVLPVLAGRAGMPLFHVAARWARWFLFAAVFAFFLDVFGLSQRPFWVHFVTGLALWFLLETGYNWLAIKALSRSDFPLFPRFRPNLDGDEWPADSRAIEVKEWLRDHGYKRLNALKAELFAGTCLRASIYECPDASTRVQVLFIPKRRGEAAACYTVTTPGEGGQRLITDNHFLPYGGYYPEGWNVRRSPLVGSLSRLVRLHFRRLEMSDIEPVPFESDPLEELNEQQRVLERINTETGFLVPRPQQQIEGKITSEGRYRLWKEMWCLAYLGRPTG